MRTLKRRSSSKSPRATASSTIAIYYDKSPVRREHDATMEISGPGPDFGQISQAYATLATEFERVPNLPVVDNGARIMEMLTTLVGNTDGVQRTVNMIQQDVNTLKEDVRVLKDGQVRLEGRMDRLEGRMSSLESRMGGIEDRMSNQGIATTCSARYGWLVRGPGAVDAAARGCGPQMDTLLRL